MHERYTTIELFYLLCHFVCILFEQQSEATSFDLFNMYCCMYIDSPCRNASKQACQPLKNKIPVCTQKCTLDRGVYMPASRGLFPYIEILCRNKFLYTPSTIPVHKSVHWTGGLTCLLPNMETRSQQIFCTVVHSMAGSSSLCVSCGGGRGLGLNDCTVCIYCMGERQTDSLYYSDGATKHIGIPT